MLSASECDKSLNCIMYALTKVGARQIFWGGDTKKVVYHQHSAGAIAFLRKFNHFRYRYPIEEGRWKYY